MTKQEDMSAFYRNLLDQTTETVVKTELAQTEDNVSTAERYVLAIHQLCIASGSLDHDGLLCLVHYIQVKARKIMCEISRLANYSFTG